MGVKVQRPSGPEDWTTGFAKGGTLPPDTPREQEANSRRRSDDMPLAEISVRENGRDDWIRTRRPSAPRSTCLCDQAGATSRRLKRD